LTGISDKPAWVPGDLNTLANAMVAFSSFATSGNVQEAEANPLLLRHEGAGVVFLDAFVRPTN